MSAINENDYFVFSLLISFAFWMYSLVCRGLIGIHVGKIQGFFQWQILEKIE